MFAVPSKETPPIVLAFCKAVAVEAFPVRVPVNEPLKVVLPNRPPFVKLNAPATSKDLNVNYNFIICNCISA